MAEVRGSAPECRKYLMIRRSLPAAVDQITSFVERRGNGCFCRDRSFVHPLRSGRGNSRAWNPSVYSILVKWLWKGTLAVPSQGRWRLEHAGHTVHDDVPRQPGSFRNIVRMPEAFGDRQTSNVGYWQDLPFKTSPGNGTNVPNLAVAIYRGMSPLSGDRQAIRYDRD